MTAEEDAVWQARIVPRYYTDRIAYTVHAFTAGSAIPLKMPS